MGTSRQTLKETLFLMDCFFIYINRRHNITGECLTKLICYRKILIILPFEFVTKSP